MRLVPPRHLLPRFLEELLDGGGVGGVGAGNSEDSSSNDGASAMNGPRTISDLLCTAASAIDEVAREIAKKLYEEKDDLLCE